MLIYIKKIRKNLNLFINFLFFNKNIKIRLLLIIIAILIALSVFLFLYKVQDTKESLSYLFNGPDLYQNKIILFHSDDCVHCLTVDNFIEKNKIEDKVDFIRLNVESKENVNILLQKYRICGLDEKQAGVPFVFDGINRKCLAGYVDVIEFFRSELKK